MRRQNPMIVRDGGGSPFGVVEDHVVPVTIMEGDRQSLVLGDHIERPVPPSGSEQRRAWRHRDAEHSRRIGEESQAQGVVRPAGWLARGDEVRIDDLSAHGLACGLCRDLQSRGWVLELEDMVEPRGRAASLVPGRPGTR
jgi:hypothetical protein